MIFWPILGQRKTSLVIFYEKEREFSCLFDHNIISNGLYQALRNKIVAKMTTELIILFSKNITKLVFLCPNMGQKSIKVLINYYEIIYLNLEIFL